MKGGAVGFRNLHKVVFVDVRAVARGVNTESWFMRIGKSSG